MDLMHADQLEVIRWLHQIRGPFVDGFFRFLNFFDSQEFLFVLIPAVWIGYHWKSGLKLFYILILSGLVNYTCKQIFGHPRPFHMDATLAIIHVRGFGFPSGGAQTAVLLAGILLNYVRNKWGWIVAINFVFWVSLSRIYLGAHFLTDVLGGWILGFALWAVFTYVFPAIEKRLKSKNLSTLLLMSAGVPIALLYFFYNSYVFPLCVTSIGVAIGVFICSRYKLFLPLPKNWKVLVARTALGVGGTFVLFITLNSLAKAIHSNLFFTQFLVLGLWLSIGATLVWRWLARKA